MSNPVRYVLLAALLLSVPMIISVAQDSTKSNDSQKSDGPEFRPQRLLREQPPIIHFEIKSADDAVSLHPTELVLGVVIGGKARAYPINMLTNPHREIINDRLNDTPIAATW